MKNIPEKIQEQNAVAISVLNHLLSDHVLKRVIHKFGSELAKNILQLLIQKVEEADELGVIDEKSKQTITHLMLHHSDKGRQYDGIRMETSWETLNNKVGVLSVLCQMNELLSDINQCTTIQSLTNYFKSMYDISAAFVQELAGEHNEFFNQLISIIMPTVAEYGSRISFTEVGDKKKQYATTFGLFATSRDLIDETQVSEEISVAEARITGKSLFKEITTIERYRLIFTNYLFAKENYEKHIDTVEVEARDQAEAHFLNQIQKMINLDIPLDLTIEDLEAVDRIAKANETWIEKIARRDKAPLVAGISGSTGRLLISLIHFKLIQADEASINELQILANCIAAHMVFQGHHSFDEVHEASRRAIDALLIADTPKKEDILKVIDHPFYKVGANFLHHSYVDKVLMDSQEHLPVAAMMPFKY
ncbi:hypothetical protein [Legionella sp.]|uniref:hypothetical protein n=1 Tax=Legionella sp. TaxID=459 RepID=UPI003C86286C